MCLKCLAVLIKSSWTCSYCSVTVGRMLLLMLEKAGAPPHGWGRGWGLGVVMARVGVTSCLLYFRGLGTALKGIVEVAVHIMASSPPGATHTDEWLPKPHRMPIVGSHLHQHAGSPSLGYRWRSWQHTSSCPACCKPRTEHLSGRDDQVEAVTIAMHVPCLWCIPPNQSLDTNSVTAHVAAPSYPWPRQSLMSRPRRLGTSLSVLAMCGPVVRGSEHVYISSNSSLMLRSLLANRTHTMAWARHYVRSLHPPWQCRVERSSPLQQSWSRVV